ncbi:MAG: sulfotransferase [Parvularculaceae bacterium]|nr:sulfotransferase [Parvularculaceae bacterium]
MSQTDAITLDQAIEQTVTLLNAGDSASARLLAERALAAAPQNASAVNAMGLVEMAQHNFEAAAKLFRAAAAHAPAEPGFAVNLAYACITAGDFDEARAHLYRALELDPQNASAYQNLAWITKARPGDAIIDRIRAAIARAPEGSEPFIKLAYALGKCLDDVGDYDAAFDWFRRANECQPSRYDAARHEKFFSDLKQSFDADRIAAQKPNGFDSRKPIFIVGMPRSGSTLLEEKLCAHEGVVGLGETGDIITFSNAMAAAHPRRAPFPEWVADAPEGTLRGLGKHYVEKYSKRHPQAERLVNKALLNHAYVGLIAMMLPNAMIVETRRNPIDTCLSCYFKDLKPIHHYAIRLETLGHFYRLYADLMAHWREVLPGLATVQYEQFIDDAPGAASALLQSSGLMPKRGGGRAAPRHVQTFSAWQVKQPVYRHAVERWRNYEKHIGPLIDSLGDLA